MYSHFFFVVSINKYFSVIWYFEEISIDPIAKSKVRRNRECRGVHAPPPPCILAWWKKKNRVLFRNYYSKRFPLMIAAQLFGTLRHPWCTLTFCLEENDWLIFCFTPIWLSELYVKVIIKKRMGQNIRVLNFCENFWQKLMIAELEHEYCHLRRQLVQDIFTRDTDNDCQIPLFSSKTLFRYFSDGNTIKDCFIYHFHRCYTICIRYKHHQAIWIFIQSIYIGYPNSAALGVPASVNS